MDKLQNAQNNIVKVQELSLPIKIGILIGGSVLSLICLAYPIAMIAIGGQHKDECPLNYLIPIWLIVSGTVSMVSVIIGWIKFAVGILLKNKKHTLCLINLLGLYVSIISLFSAAWFIVGSVWVYGPKPLLNTADTGSAYFCQYKLYWFAFWTITVSYIILALACCAGCIAIVPIAILAYRSQK